ncbi:MAG: sigma-70 family RNA polymerase sigma factor [Fuerstiella sp.]|nr:sigma-70 family RNA polymerase sigma factor [Fuerstiella sp.]MCP4859168.1 sigma-70 family RNA polymerase sigma factor [Fuerstiella sp.]
MDESTRKATLLWTSAQPIVAAFVAAVVRDFRDREDVLQETALAVFRSIDSYDSNLPFNAWAIGIARNQVGLYLRRRKRDRHVFGDTAIACLEAAFSRASSSAKLDFLAECMRQLDGRSREMCDLRHQEDIKPGAIAEKLGMTANAVSKTLQRVRHQLRICIKSKAAVEGATE